MVTRGIFVTTAIAACLGLSAAAAENNNRVSGADPGLSTSGGSQSYAKYDRARASDNPALACGIVDYAPELS